MRLLRMAIGAAVWAFAATASADARTPGERDSPSVLRQPSAENCPIATVAARPFHPERLLVRFKSGAKRSKRQVVHDAARAKKVLRDYHLVKGLQLVEIPETQLTTALSVYKDHADVLYAEPDYTLWATGTPNDPKFGELWGLHNTGQMVNGKPGTPGADIRAVQAWDFWTGDADFRIAVIDSGVDYNHPDLQANIWTNPGEIPGNEIDDDENGYVDDIHGYDFYDNDGDPMDEHGHGSHVSGTIGAVGNNDEGVVGVNWQCKIVGLRFLGGG